MKTGMTRLIALLLALMLTLSVSALAAETVSDGYRVDGAQERPEEPASDEIEAAPETGSEIPTVPDATKEPVEIPTEPIGQQQVCLNSDSDSVKIFESADSASPVVGNAFHGDVVDVFVSADGWCFIQMGGTKGWIASGHLKEVGAADTPEPTATPEPVPKPTRVPVPEEPIGQKQVCLNDVDARVNMFAAAVSASEIVGTLGHGDVVDVYVEAGAWTLVRANGAQGWVASGHLKAVGSAEPKQPEETEVPAPVEPEETPEPTEPEATEVPAPVEPEETPEPKQPEATEVPAPVEPEETPEPAEPEETEVPAPVEPEETETSAPKLPKMYVVLPAVDGMVNVRESAGNDGRIIGTLHHGDAVAVLGRDGSWVQVRAADGTEGFVYGKYLSDVKPEAAAPEATPEPEATEKPEATVEPEASEEPEVPAFEYERDEEGELMLDENGNPIPVLPEDAMEKPVVFQRDEEGNLVLDENGDPIPVQFVPVEAEKIDSEPDAENPNRHVDIYADFGGDVLTMGQQLNLIAAFDGYDGLEYTIQWQTSMDDATWTDVEGATSATLPVVVTEETYVSYWRVEVTITGVIGAEATAPEEAEAAPAAEA